jgi:hypothetical protein
MFSAGLVNGCHNLFHATCVSLVRLYVGQNPLVDVEDRSSPGKWSGETSHERFTKQQDSQEKYQKNMTVYKVNIRSLNSCPPVIFDDHQLPQADEAKYLGLHLDRRPTWQKHIWLKRLQLGAKLRQMYWILGRNSQLSLDNKLLSNSKTSLVIRIPTMGNSKHLQHWEDWTFPVQSSKNRC